MRIVSCPACHTQFDVTDVARDELTCPCGETFRNISPLPVDAEIRRCGSCGASVGPGAEMCDYCESTIVRDDEQLSLICPECYARNAEESAFCAGCGVRFTPQPVHPEGEELGCPCCDKTMKRRSIGGVLVHECTSCHGLWAPGESFDSLIRRAIEMERNDPLSDLEKGKGHTPPRPFEKNVVYRLCPVCSGHMPRKNFARRSGIIVDWCGAHGTWLDANELEEIASFILGGGLEKAKETMAREKKREEKAASRRRADRAQMKMSGGSCTHATAGSIGDLLEGLLGW